MAVTVGGILPQRGGVWGGGISIDGMAFDDETHPGPTTLAYKAPEKIGHAVSGNPIYQGPPGLIATWNVCEIDTFQALAVIFFSKSQYPFVEIVWPDPQQAGRYIRAQAFMGWPVSKYEAGFLRDVSVEFFSLRELSSGYF